MEATHASPAESVGREQPVLMAWKTTLALAWTAGITLGSAPSPSWPCSAHSASGNASHPQKRLDSFVSVFTNICQVLSAQSIKTAGEINVKLRGCLFGFFFKSLFSICLCNFFENKMVKALQITTLLHRAMCQLL